MPELSISTPLHWFQRLMSFLGRFELATLILLAVVAGGTFAFVKVSSEVMEGDSEAFDRAILLALRSPHDLAEPLGPLWFQEMARDATALGGLGFLAFLTLAVAGYLLMLGKPRIMVFVLAAVVGGLLFSLAAKGAFGRPRPDLVAHRSHVYTASFPSGHAMMAAVSYLTLGTLLARVQTKRRLKAYLLLVAIILTVLVGLSRVYLGVHWPTDVLAGWALGAVWAAMCGLIARWLQRRGQVERSGETEESLHQVAGPL